MLLDLNIHPNAPTSKAKIHGSCVNWVALKTFQKLLLIILEVIKTKQI